MTASASEYASTVMLVLVLVLKDQNAVLVLVLVLDDAVLVLVLAV